MESEEGRRSHLLHHHHCCCCYCCLHQEHTRSINYWYHMHADQYPGQNEPTNRPVGSKKSVDVKKPRGLTCCTTTVIVIVIVVCGSCKSHKRSQWTSVRAVAASRSGLQQGQFHHALCSGESKCCTASIVVIVVVVGSAPCKSHQQNH